MSHIKLRCSIICMALIFITTGCSQKMPYNAEQETGAKAVQVAENYDWSYSHDGTHAVLTNIDQEKGIYQVVLKDGESKDSENTKTFDIIGTEFQYIWAPDNQQVCITYSGRIWKDFSILNTNTKELIEHPILEDVFRQLREGGTVVAYELRVFRPDPYLQPLEWSPDSSKLLVSYVWFDQNSNVQNGVFVYDVAAKKFSRMVQSPPAEGETIQPEKPDDFTW